MLQSVHLKFGSICIAAREIKS